jgi:segregation and condensation protein B
MPDSTASIVEALLFVSSEPLDAPILASVIGVRIDEIEAALVFLREHYAACGHGIRVETSLAGARLVTAPETGPAVAALLGSNRTPRLSAAALDVLAIVAYKQPVTRVDIESIRGVGSDHVLTVLITHCLIEEVGRADTIGRPLLYGTTSRFLQSAGLTSLADLPPLADPRSS